MNCHNRGCYYNFYGTCNAIHKLDISKDGVCMTKMHITNSTETKDITLPYKNHLSTEIGGYNE